MDHMSYVVESPHEYTIGNVEAIIQSMTASIMEETHIIIVLKEEVTPPQGHKVN